MNSTKPTSPPAGLRILVVDDDDAITKTLADILRIMDYRPVIAHTADEALALIAGEEPFACVLSDIKMPGINGVEMHHIIKTRWPDLPVVLMTAYAADELVEQGMAEGVIGVLRKPLNLHLLLNFFSSLRRERAITIVDDDPNFCQVLGDLLRLRGFSVIQITDPQQLEVGEEPAGQVVLLDMKLKDKNGLEILKDIRAQHPRLPVILVTGYRAEMTAAIQAALEVGAFACLYKPFETDQLLQLLTKIYHQELTGLLRQD